MITNPASVVGAQPCGGDLGLPSDNRRAARLDNYPVIRSNDPEAVHAALVDVFGVRGFDMTAPRGELDVRANHWRSRGVGISYCSYGAQVRVLFPAAGSVRQQFCMQGSAEIALGRNIATLSSAETHIIPSDRKVDAKFGEGYEQFVLHLDGESLLKTATALNGEAPKKQLNFDAITSSDTPQQRHLRRLVAFLINELDGDGNGTAITALAELEQAILVAFLHANPNNYVAEKGTGPKTAASWVVRRVEEYIEANWANAIALEDFLRITSVSARTIFYHFRRTRGYSPYEFLRNVRLRHVRHLLSTGEARTVTDAALTCGFANLGHFARAYSAYFGERPSETLRRAEGVKSIP